MHISHFTAPAQLRKKGLKRLTRAPPPSVQFSTPYINCVPIATSQSRNVVMIACAIISHFWLFFSLSLSFLFFNFFSKRFLKLWSKLEKGKREKGSEQKEKEEEKEEQLAHPFKISTAVGPPMAHSWGLKMGFIKGLSPLLITPNYHRVLLLKRMAAWQRTNTLSIHSFSATTEHLYLCYKSSATYWSPLMHRLLISYEAGWLRSFSSGKYYGKKGGPSFIGGFLQGPTLRPMTGCHLVIIDKSSMIEWVAGS